MDTSKDIRGELQKLSKEYIGDVMCDAWMDKVVQVFKKYTEEQRGAKERLKKERANRIIELRMDIIKSAVLVQEAYEWAIDDLVEGLEKENGK